METFKRWIPSLVLLPVCIYLYLNNGHTFLLDGADLVIHESGHFFFGFFGQFIKFLGGTLMQIIFPVFIAWYFLRNGYRFGVQVCLVWLGQNLLSISVYAADARAKALPLLGGKGTTHDWSYILGSLSMLDYDHEVGMFFVILALLTFLFALLMPLVKGIEI